MAHQASSVPSPKPSSRHRQLTWRRKAQEVPPSGLKPIGGGGFDLEATLRDVDDAAPFLGPEFRTRFKTTKIFIRGDPMYETFRYQYALSSKMEGGYMQPAAIIYPQADRQPDVDVIAAVQYAREKGLAVAVRTGGHQYSGASSTHGNNIQLDLSEAYHTIEGPDSNGEVTFGVSWRLQDLRAKLAEMGMFVPLGQCAYVYAGGHAQTGGYGQLLRSFGLFGDFIVQLRVIMADGQVRTPRRDSTDESDQRLFYAVLGGGPGSFGALTHITLKPGLDINHPHVRGFRSTSLYTTERLKALLELKGEMASDVDFPRDIDFTVTVTTDAAAVMPNLFGSNIDQRHILEVLLNASSVSGYYEQSAIPSLIIVWLSWGNTQGPAQPFDGKSACFFRKVKEAVGVPSDYTFSPTVDGLFGLVGGTLVSFDGQGPMSYVAANWIFNSVREYTMPYNKRVYAIKKQTWAGRDWIDALVGQVDKIQRDKTKGCKLVFQFVPVGGRNSQFRVKADNKTSYSWRQDTNVVLVFDVFYNEGDLWAYLYNKKPKQVAATIQAENDALIKGPQGLMSPNEDRRLLWGSYGDGSEFNMGNAWPLYHESKQKYDKHVSIKREIDPACIFCANPFTVGYQASGRSVETPDILPASLDEFMMPVLVERFQAEL